MPTQLDRALNSKVRYLSSAHIMSRRRIGSDIFPQQPDPTGEPENWTEEEMRRWLNRRNLMASSSSTKEELLARVKANMRAPQ
ncbi:hypothetical protein KCU67_g14868, partial [Aureobasidium melanogenum]